MFFFYEYIHFQIKTQHTALKYFCEIIAYKHRLRFSILNLRIQFIMLLWYMKHFWKVYLLRDFRIKLGKCRIFSYKAERGFIKQGE